jgi:hypothetical protein
MSAPDEPSVHVGAVVRGDRGRRVGRVDAVFADYLLVRTPGFLPVDLYVPRAAVVVEDGRLRVAGGPREAYARWHRPLKRAPHPE